MSLYKLGECVIYKGVQYTVKASQIGATLGISDIMIDLGSQTAEVDKNMWYYDFGRGFVKEIEISQPVPTQGAEKLEIK